MCLSDCSSCKYFDRDPHHLDDIVCSLNPAYASVWKCLKSLDEYTLNCVPIDNCQDFDLDPTLKEKQISLSLSFTAWQTLANESRHPSILKALQDTSIQVNLSLTLKEWQAVADSNTDPFVRVALEEAQIKPRRDPWICVDSSCIDAVAYPPGSCTFVAHSLAPDGDAGSLLKIRFVSGLIYQYDNVPHGIFLNLLDANSKGSFFNTHIRDVYHYRQI